MPDARPAAACFIIRAIRKVWSLLSVKFEIFHFWGRRIAAKYGSEEQNLFRSRGKAAAGLNRSARAQILFIEDRIPFPWLGAGFPRTGEFLRALVDLDYFVTFFPTIRPIEHWAEVHSAISEDVEVALGYGSAGLNYFLRSRKDFYDACIVSRPHNMARLGKIIRRHFPKGGRAPLIYDAEALFCMRQIHVHALRGQPLSSDEQAKMISAELALTKNCDAIISVSSTESAIFRGGRTKSSPRIYVLPHCITASTDVPSLSPGHGFVFVGALHPGVTPNVDSITWFIETIFPIIRAQRPDLAKLVVAGSNLAKLDFSRHEGVEHVGQVEDLNGIYNRARVFVAPTRFSAGVPLKVYEAAAAGVPVVATSLLANQLGWSSEELLIADNATDFAAACIRLHEDENLWERIRGSALRRVTAECSWEKFRGTVETIVTESLSQVSSARRV